MTRWPGVWTMGSSRPHRGQGPRCPRGDLTQCCHQVSLSQLLGRTKKPGASSTFRCPASSPSPRPAGHPRNLSSKPLLAALGKCGQRGCPHPPHAPQGQPSTLCSPRQSSKAVSWWRLDSEEFNRSWMLSRSS